MYLYCKSLYILIVVYVFLSLSMYSYVFLDAATLTEFFSVLFPQLQGKCQDITRQDGAQPALSQIVVLFCVLWFCVVLFYCLCVNVYCTTATKGNPIAVNKYINNGKRITSYVGD